MEAKEKKRIYGLGTWLLAILGLALVGVLLHDFNGVEYGAVGALIWGGATLITFVLCTAYVSRRVLPLQDNAGWSAGFRLLWRNYTQGAADLLYGNQPAITSVSATKKKKTPVAQLSPSFALLRAGFLFSHEAAAITRGNSYSRADGPGLVFLRSGESITQVFDLRPQARKLPVSATTRDGIPIETSVSVVFQVRRPPPGRRPRSIESDVIPYPYDREALFELTYFSSVAGDERLDWTEHVAPQAAALLVSEIGKYTLDELLVSGGAEPVGEIKERIKSSLKEQQADDLQMLPQGLEIMNVGVGGFEVPPDVMEKQLSSWRVEWENRIDEEAVGGDIEAQRIYAAARARAQVESVENLLLSIDAMRRESGVELHEVVMTRIVEVLEALSTSRGLGSLSSGAALSSLATEAGSELRRALAQDEESSD
jgi:regulator of protease activity HflC (stomatin/prohibitin superfamily)